MNILGMGPMEILLIVVLALIVFGPARLPEIMGQVGKGIADFRRATSQLSDEFNRTIQAELQETRSVVDDTKSAVTGVHTSINSALTGAPAPVRTAAAGEGGPVPNSTTPEATPNGVGGSNGTTGTASPPLADTSQWSWETAAPAPTKPPLEGATTDATASAADAAVATVQAAPPVAAEPSTPPQDSPKPAATPRKSAARNDLLPPY